MLNQIIFRSCPFDLDVGYFFCSPSLLFYYHLFPRDSPTNTPPRHRNIERARECQGRILERPEHRKTPQSLSVGGGVPFNLPFPIPPPVAPLQIPPAPVGDNLFVGFHIMPEWMKCGSNVASLINALYPGLATLSQNTRNDQYFLHWTIPFKQLGMMMLMIPMKLYFNECREMS